MKANAYQYSISEDKILLIDSNFDMNNWNEKYLDGTYWLLHTSKLGVGFDYNLKEEQNVFFIYSPQTDTVATAYQMITRTRKIKTLYGWVPEEYHDIKFKTLETFRKKNEIRNLIKIQIDYLK